jgi:predicted transcriptional regulator
MLNNISKFLNNNLLSKLIPETARVIAPKRDLTTPDLIIVILQKSPDISLRVVAEKIGKSLRAVKDATKKLQLEGRLKRIGPKKGGYWKVIED